MSYVIVWECSCYRQLIAQVITKKYYQWTARFWLYTHRHLKIYFLAKFYIKFWIVYDTNVVWRTPRIWFVGSCVSGCIDDTWLTTVTDVTVILTQSNLWPVSSCSVNVPHEVCNVALIGAPAAFPSQGGLTCFTMDIESWCNQEVSCDNLWLHILFASLPVGCRRCGTQSMHAAQTSVDVNSGTASRAYTVTSRTTVWTSEFSFEHFNITVTTDMAWCRTAVTPLRTHWSYHHLALNILVPSGLKPWAFELLS